MKSSRFNRAEKGSLDPFLAIDDGMEWALYPSANQKKPTFKTAPIFLTTCL